MVDTPVVIQIVLRLVDKVEATEIRARVTMIEVETDIVETNDRSIEAHGVTTTIEKTLWSVETIAVRVTTQVHHDIVAAIVDAIQARIQTAVESGLIRQKRQRIFSNIMSRAMSKTSLSTSSSIADAPLRV